MMVVMVMIVLIVNALGRGYIGSDNYSNDPNVLSLLNTLNPDLFNRILKLFAIGVQGCPESFGC